MYFLALGRRVMESSWAAFSQLWDSVPLPIPAGVEVVYYIFSISLRSISSCGVSWSAQSQLCLPQEILKPGTHGMCTTQKYPWNPTHTGSEACKSTRQVGTQPTQDTRTQPASASWGRFPFQLALGRASKLCHTFTHTSHTTHSLPKPLSRRNQRRGAGTLRQRSADFPSQRHRLGRSISLVYTKDEWSRCLFFWAWFGSYPSAQELQKFSCVSADTPR